MVLPTVKISRELVKQLLQRMFLVSPVKLLKKELHAILVLPTICIFLSGIRSKKGCNFNFINKLTDHHRSHQETIFNKLNLS